MMTDTHKAAWIKFQNALLNLCADPGQYKYLLNSQRHQDAVHILGRGTEEQLKYEMHQWMIDYPKLFAEIAPPIKMHFHAGDLISVFGEPATVLQSYQVGADVQTDSGRRFYVGFEHIEDRTEDTCTS